MKVIITSTFLLLSVVGSILCRSATLQEAYDASGDGSDDFEIPISRLSSPNSVATSYTSVNNGTRKPYTGFTRPALTDDDDDDSEYEIDIDSSGDMNIVTVCKDDWFCNHGSECYIIISTNKPFCQCKVGYKGDHCEFVDNSDEVKKIEKEERTPLVKPKPSDDSKEVQPSPDDMDTGPVTVCKDEWFCLHGSMCYVVISSMKPFCQCAAGYKGDHCEIDDLMITAQDEPMTPTEQTLTMQEIMQHPIVIAVLAGAGLLALSLLVLLLLCCCRVLRKKDEGSYKLDVAVLGGQRKIEYTKVHDSQEFYA